MLDIKYIRENHEAILEGARKKRIKVDLSRLLTLDSEQRPLVTELEQFQAERNRISKEIPKLDPAAREEAKAKVASIKTNIEALEAKISALKSEFEGLMLLVPQPARSDVPEGKDDQENVEVRRVGKVKSFSFKPRTHMEIGKLHDWIDAERGVKLAGSRSYVLKGWGARLEQAVLRLTFDLLCKKGFEPLSVPVLVTDACMTGTGYFPTGREQAFYIEKDELALVGTAEVPVTSFYSSEILKTSDLPKRMFAWSSCFRREAGTYGKDTQGLYRVHQFQKVEQVIVAPADPKQSEALHDEILSNAEEVLNLLELPYRVVYVCTGDLGQGQVRKHDIETWMPSRQAYAETHSCSTFHDFQARRLRLRYKDDQGETRYCYTLNNTAVASPRILIPLLEYHQQEDGRVWIPPALRGYLDEKEFLG